MKSRYTYLSGLVLMLFCLVVCSAAPVFAADHAGKKDMSLSPIDFQMETAVWTLVIFLIVVCILGKFAFRPIANALDAREKAVADQISSAHQANEEAKNVLGQYQQKLADSKDEVREILETARQDAQRGAAGIMEKAQEEAGNIRERAKKEIEAATANALQNIAERSATLATQLAGKMIKADVTPEAHGELIRGALEEFAKN